MQNKQLLRPHCLFLCLAILIAIVGCQLSNQEEATQDKEIASDIMPPSTGLNDQATSLETNIVDLTRILKATATTANKFQATEQSVTQETNGPAEQVKEPDADVEFVRAVQGADGHWTFHVTLRHPDTGWEDYANGWDVVTVDGKVLKRNNADEFTRLLLHPHENEQPFTRSQSGLSIPEGVSQVIVRAHDIIDGFGGREIVVDLNEESGSGYEVKRQ